MERESKNLKKMEQIIKSKKINFPFYTSIFKMQSLFAVGLIVFFVKTSTITAFKKCVRNFIAKNKFVKHVTE